ncbi:hypothetical protein B5M42_021045 [Paenibacillus athensensis]|uniref:Uncharacterized protein n=1 Tax=Paenibacillus athensensis TaxID=1967502 RepID=A0A4Y8PT59_9BACL|nr:hypothetical protein [Paenibacillus athensensis]MCD1261290.1 hypothetical protein [Paenibacillus athensensis]
MNTNQTTSGMEHVSPSGFTVMNDPGSRTVIQEVEAWLQGQVGRVLYIRKGEQRDMDRIGIRLQRVELRHREEPVDAYESAHELILHGQGWTETQGEAGPVKSPLPEEVFEIPLLGRCTAVETETGLELATGRACYWIEREASLS